MALFHTMPAVTVLYHPEQLESKVICTEFGFGEAVGVVEVAA